MMPIYAFVRADKVEWVHGDDYADAVKRGGGEPDWHVQMPWDRPPYPCQHARADHATRTITEDRSGRAAVVRAAAQRERLRRAAALLDEVEQLLRLAARLSSPALEDMIAEAQSRYEAALTEATDGQASVQ